MIGLYGQKNFLLENHVTPDGKYLLICDNGINLYEFKRKKELDTDQIVLEKKEDFSLPMRTNDFENAELATRIRFESKYVIRYLSLDKRDILFKINYETMKAEYICEYSAENVF